MELLHQIAEWVYHTFGPSYKETPVVFHSGVIRDSTSGQFRKVSSRQFASYLGARLNDPNVILYDEIPVFKRVANSTSYLESAVNLWPTEDREVLTAMRAVIQNRG